MSSRDFPEAAAGCGMTSRFSSARVMAVSRGRPTRLQSSIFASCRPLVALVQDICASLDFTLI